MAKDVRAGPFLLHYMLSRQLWLSYNLFDVYGGKLALNMAHMRCSRILPIESRAKTRTQSETYRYSAMVAPGRQWQVDVWGESWEMGRTI